MSFAPYPRYRDSGSRWLGSLPDHWRWRRLRFEASLNPSKREAADIPRQTEVTFVPMSGLTEVGTIEKTNLRSILDVETGYTYFKNGDVIIAKVTPCFENGKGACAADLIGGIGFGTTELTVVRSNEIDRAGFLYWVLSSSNFRGPAQAEMVGAGGLKRVPDDFFKNFHMPIPPLAEAVAIAAFLTSQTFAIDRLMLTASATSASGAEKGSLLEVLAERRAALISAAITGKINVRSLAAAPEEVKAA